MAKTDPISVRLEPEAKAALERMAKVQGRKVAAQAAWVITVGAQEFASAELAVALAKEMEKRKK